MAKLKVMTIVGTRPEIIRLSMLVKKLDQLTEHTLVHTGQNNDPNLNEVFFSDLQLRPADFYLGVNTSSMAQVMGETMIKVEKLLMEIRPQAVMILGDTNSAVAAIVAERLHIPVYHMEAGNRSFDANVPEELNRRMIDHVASFNLPYNDYSMRNLLAEGIHPRRIQKTGSPIQEIFSKFGGQITANPVLETLGLSPKRYILVSVHRQENVDFPDRLRQVLDCLLALRDEFQLPILVSTHPRTKIRMEGITDLDLEGLLFHPPFGYLAYNKLQIEAFCVVSDSGTISEESSILGFPAVCLRQSIERPEALETGSIILTGLDSRSIADSVRYAVESRARRVPEGYEVDDFSERVFSFLLSTARLHGFWSGLHPGQPQ